MRASSYFARGRPVNGAQDGDGPATEAREAIAGKGLEPEREAILAALPALRVGAGSLTGALAALSF